MKKYIKVVSILLATLLFILSFSGCKSDNDYVLSIELNSDKTEFSTSENKALVTFYAQTDEDFDSIRLVCKENSELTADLLNNHNDDNIYSGTLELDCTKEINYNFYAISGKSKSNNITIYIIAPFSEKELDDTDIVDNAISELMTSDEYVNSDLKSRKKQVKKLLNSLADKRLIEKSSIKFKSNEFYFIDSSGIENYYSIEDEDDSLASNKFLTNELYRDSLSTENSFINFTENIQTEQFVNSNAIIMYGLDDYTEKKDNTYDSYNSLCKYWCKFGLKTDIYAETTVELYKTSLKDKSLIVIAEHGLVNKNDKNFRAFILREKATRETKKAYEFDLRQKRIVKANGCFSIKPEFFSYYYGDNGLDNSIIYLGSCSGFGRNGKEDYKFSYAFENDCGVNATLGFHNDVKIAYGFQILNIFSESLIKGYTTKEALDNAINKYCSNDVEYWLKYKNEDISKQKKPSYPIITSYYSKLYGSVCTGVVKDKVTNKAIKDVVVEIIDNDIQRAIEVIASTQTNDKGEFTLNIPYGNYSIQFNHDNYEYYGTTVDVNTSTVALNNPILLKPKQLKMTDFIGMTVDGIVKIYGTDYKITESSSWIPDSGGKDRIIYYEDSRIPFQLLASVGEYDAPLQPKGSDKIVEVSIKPNFEKIFSINGKLNTDITYSKLKETTSGTRWTDSAIGYIYTYEYDNISIDFVYNHLPEDNSVADEIMVIADRDWELYDDDWGGERYKNYIVYQSVIDEYNENCNKNHSASNRDFKSCSCSWAVCDIDGNGAEELIIQEGTCEQDKTHHIYTIKNGKAIELGEYNAWHLGLYEENGKTIAVRIAPGDSIITTIYNFKIFDNSIELKEVKEMKNSDYYNDNPIEFTEIYYALVDVF